MFISPRFLIDIPVPNLQLRKDVLNQSRIITEPLCLLLSQSASQFRQYTHHSSAVKLCSHDTITTWPRLKNAICSMQSNLRVPNQSHTFRCIPQKVSHLIECKISQCKHFVKLDC